ncbi:MAG TPA: EAL domain-containing protein [Acidimicrobiales bacterium]|nr:EAL domain-containing protein [Acidimicrobiales bacterium]
MSLWSGLRRRAADVLPKGAPLAEDEWARRHYWILLLLYVHVPALVLFGALNHRSLVHCTMETLPVVICAYVASQRVASRQVRSVLAALGLMLCSAILVHLSGGVTEMHFHFFVMLGVISLYQDWRPFLVAIGFVTLHHGVMGILRPRDVFDHASAWHSPVKWAVIHGGFVLAASAVSVVAWRIIEDDHRRSQEKLAERERRFRALIEHSSDMIALMDATGTLVYSSPSTIKVLGYTPEEAVGRPATDFDHPDDADRARPVLERVLSRPGSSGEMDLRLRHKDGGYRWVHMVITNLLDEPGVNAVVSNARDINEQRALQDQLSHQAFHDPLTGLPNRALLADRVDHALTARRNLTTHLAVLYIDLDDFKEINDTLGHQAGDVLLQASGERIVSCLRPGDTASRLGGDEFAVLLEELPTPGAAYEIGARILEMLREPFEIEDTLVTVNASIGIAVSSGREEATELVRNADLAMYRAKNGGKGRFEIYETGMHAAVVARMDLKADLRRAVDADEFHPHYQPIVDLADNRVIGVEALVRWHHPERGIVLPGSFIPLAEDTGLIVRIGQKMLREACADLARWQAELGDGAPATVSVNISARELQNPTLLDDVKHALADSGLPGSALVIEVTESMLMEDTHAATRVLRDLKELGLSVALDDFGTGYSSLSYLDRFPVDIVKIDKSFIDMLPPRAGATSGSTIAGAIISLGATLGVNVTAEGIEDRPQLALLRKMGCASGQGYLFAKPMPGDELAAQLRSTAAGDAPRVAVPIRP